LSRARLRESGQLPKAVAIHEKGRRGKSWRYAPETVEAYVRAEEHRRASGKRVRSWKQVAHREKNQIIREWLADPNSAVPREIIIEELERLALLFRSVASAAYGFVENPVGPLEDDRLEDAHTAIEAMLAGSNLSGEWRSSAEALLQMLIFRGEEGEAEDFDLPELLAPLRQRSGPFGTLMSVKSIGESFTTLPVNELLTHPRELLAAVTDDDLRLSAQTVNAMFSGIARVAELASVVLDVATLAQKDEKTRDDQRIGWCRTIAEGCKAITNILESDLAPSILCAVAVANVWMLRKDPNAMKNALFVGSTINNFADVVDESQPRVAAAKARKKARALKR
jgi:hypothetical protein